MNRTTIFVSLALVLMCSGWDVPESERIEKTITINASKLVKYGDVVKLIDEVKRAGATDHFAA